MKILVTGGCGFIGHNVVNILSNLNHKVIVTDNCTNYGVIDQDQIDYLISERINTIPKNINIYNIDIESTSIYQLFDIYKFDIVIHLASFPRQKVVNTNPTLASKTMVEGLLNLCEASKKYNVKKFVYVSSSMVYGDFSNDVKEDYICQPIGQYGIMKLAGENLVKDYSKRNHFTHTIIRPSAVYGPSDVEDRVVSKFFLAAMRDQTLTINGFNEILDFTYVSDIATGIVQASLSSNTENKTYNVTKSQGFTLLKAAELVVKLVGKGNINVMDKNIEYPSRGTLNIDSARKDFNYNPIVSIEEGFQKYYEYLKNSSFWLNKTI